MCEDGVERDGPHWKCPRCPEKTISADSPEEVADRVDEHLQERHGLSLDEYQKRGEIPQTERTPCWKCGYARPIFEACPNCGAYGGDRDE